MASISLVPKSSYLTSQTG